jgi:hypothetical protein
MTKKLLAAIIIVGLQVALVWLLLGSILFHWFDFAFMQLAIICTVLAATLPCFLIVVFCLIDKQPIIRRLQ